MDSPGNGKRADPELDRIIALYVDRLNGGQSLDPDEIEAEYPERASQILERLETFLGLGSGTGPRATSGCALGILGDFRLLRRLGRGGMGVVYEAWQGSMERRVALKVLPGGLL